MMSSSSVKHTNFRSKFTVNLLSNKRSLFNATYLFVIVSASLLFNDVVCSLIILVPSFDLNYRAVILQQYTFQDVHKTHDFKNSEL